MKRVLITGANSYVGTNVERWLMKEPDKYFVETLDMQDPNWKDFDFSSFDVVFHVAGIAHVSTKKSMKDLYFKVNRDLAIETAQKAKESGVKQFIFMSSMIIYNSKETRITRETKPNPDNFYGDSKLQAEQGIQKIQDSNFNICILRPPMIYGPNSKGNYPKIAKISKKIKIFPDYPSKKSAIYIDNLSAIIEYCINKRVKGVLHPQNKEYFNLSQVVKEISLLQNRKIYLTKVFNFCIMALMFTAIINKIFGSFYYDFHESFIFESKDYIRFVDSIKRSEIGGNQNE